MTYCRSQKAGVEYALIHTVTDEHYVTAFVHGEPIASVDIENPEEILRPGINGEWLATLMTRSSTKRMEENLRTLAERESDVA